jgi:hypothetical protein
MYTEENPLIKEGRILLNVLSRIFWIKDKYIFKKIKKRWFTV